MRQKVEIKYVDYSTASEHLGVSESSLRRHVMNQAIPFFKLGKRVLFTITDLDVWMESKRIAPLN
jgi:excisionase family DNA binding protein